MDKLRIRFRDWWRGFNNEDLASARRKIEAECHKPGAFVPLSGAEFNAWVKWNRHERQTVVATARRCSLTDDGRCPYP